MTKLLQELEKIESRWEDQDSLNLFRENIPTAAGPGHGGGGEKEKKKGRRPSALLRQLRAQHRHEQEASPAAPGQAEADGGESQTPAEAAAAGDDRREQELLDRILRLEQRLVEVVRQRDRAIGERYILQKRLLDEHARSAAAPE